MRRLIGLVLAAAVLYGGYWVVGSRAVLEGAEQALARMKAEGIADFSEVSIKGFPSRFDLTVTEPRFATSDGHIAWAAPFAQVFALSYRPNHVIAVLPQVQNLVIGGEPISVSSGDMRASAVFGASTALPLDHAQTVGKVITLTNGKGDGLGLSELRAAVRTMDAATNRYDIAADVAGMVPIGTASGSWATVAGDPAATGWIRLDSTATFDRPLDRRATEGDLRITGLEVSSLQLSYGRLQIDGAGVLAISRSGEPEGTLDLTLRGWQGLPQAMAEAGLVTPEVAPTLMKVLAALAVGSGGKDGALRLPLIFADGQMALGPLPLGPVPRL